LALDGRLTVINFETSNCRSAKYKGTSCEKCEYKSKKTLRGYRYIIRIQFGWPSNIQGADTFWIWPFSQLWYRISRDGSNFRTTYTKEYLFTYQISSKLDQKYRRTDMWSTAMLVSSEEMTA